MFACLQRWLHRDGRGGRQSAGAEAALGAERDDGEDFGLICKWPSYSSCALGNNWKIGCLVQRPREGRVEGCLPLPAAHTRSTCPPHPGLLPSGSSQVISSLSAVRVGTEAPDTTKAAWPL